MTAMENAAAAGSRSPGCAHRRLLVLDLDETLVHSTQFHQRPPAYQIVVGRSVISITKRPGADEFLRCAVELLDVVIYTASDCAYARRVMAVCWPWFPPSRVFSREHCVVRVGHQLKVVKDLQRFGRDLSAVFIIDDSPLVMKWYPYNSIVVPPYVGDRGDKVLLQLIPVLRACAVAPDVREALGRFPVDMLLCRSGCVTARSEGCVTAAATPPPLPVPLSVPLPLCATARSFLPELTFGDRCCGK